MSGAEDRHFRYEGKMREHIRALPASIESSRLRLYCLCYSECILILGGGGIKEKGTRTWQDDPQLTKYVKELQKIDKAMSLKIRRNPSMVREYNQLTDIDLIINE